MGLLCASRWKYEATSERELLISYYSGNDIIAALISTGSLVYYRGYIMQIKDLERIIEIIKTDKDIPITNKENIDLDFTENPHSITVTFTDHKVIYEMHFKNSKTELL